MSRDQQLAKQLALWGTAADTASEADELDRAFLHKGFAISGLPHRSLRDPRQSFSRHDDRFSLTVQPSELTLPGGAKLYTGVPAGPKSRLLGWWLGTEAQAPSRASGDRWIEIGPIVHWLRVLGIGASWGPKGSVEATKRQLLALMFARFTMIFQEGGEREDAFAQETLIEAGVLKSGDLNLWAQGRLADISWPEGVRLSQRAYERFQQDAITIPTARLRRVAHNAMAMDQLAYFAYCLPQLPRDESRLLSWKALIRQFGNGERVSKFKSTFGESIKAALDAYPEAQVAWTDEGLVLRHSDPVDVRAALVVVRGLPFEQRGAGDSNEEKKIGGASTAMAKA